MKPWLLLTAFCITDGVMAETGISVKNTNATELARLMVGRNVELGVIRRSKNIADKSFEIKNLNLTTGGHSILSDINMKDTRVKSWELQE